MGLGDIWKLTKTLVTLADDLKKSREEIKTLSTQVNTLASALLELKIRFENFSEKEFKNFAEQETLKREKFSESERYEREKFMQEVMSLFAKAENAFLRMQLEERSKPATGKGSRKQIADGKRKSENEDD